MIFQVARIKFEPRVVVVPPEAVGYPFSSRLTTVPKEERSTAATARPTWVPEMLAVGLQRMPSLTG